MSKRNSLDVVWCTLGDLLIEPSSLFMVFFHSTLSYSLASSNPGAVCFLQCNKPNKRSNRMRLGSQFLVQHLGSAVFFFSFSPPRVLSFIYVALSCVLRRGDKKTTTSASREEKHVKCNCIFLPHHPSRLSEQWTADCVWSSRQRDSIMLSFLAKSKGNGQTGDRRSAKMKNLGQRRTTRRLKSLRSQSNFPLQCPPENCLKAFDGTKGLLSSSCFRLNEFLVYFSGEKKSSSSWSPFSLEIYIRHHKLKVLQSTWDPTEKVTHARSLSQHKISIPVCRFLLTPRFVFAFSKFNQLIKFPRTYVLSFLSRLFCHSMTFATRYSSMISF